MLLVLPAAWGTLALWYRFAGSRILAAAGATLWGGFSIAMLCSLWYGRFAAGIGGFASGFVLLMVWWVRLRPQSEGDWADDVAHITTGTIEGNHITLHHLRNFDWRTNEDYTPRWETRTYDLDRLRSVDMIMSYWRGPAIAHMLISFGFEAGSHVVFSVEIRRKKTQSFSEIGGFFKEFELCILAADELDAIRLRTTVRRERVHLYRLALPAAARLLLFLSYVGEGNRLAKTPRFYNTVAVNCTTMVYQMMKRIFGHLPLSYRLLFSGYMPEYVYGVGGLEPGRPLEELRDLGFITDRAQRAEHCGNFSAAIRRGIPGVD